MLVESSTGFGIRPLRLKLVSHLINIIRNIYWLNCWNSTKSENVNYTKAHISIRTNTDATGTSNNKFTSTPSNLLLNSLSKRNENPLESIVTTIWGWNSNAASTVYFILLCIGFFIIKWHPYLMSILLRFDRNYLTHWFCHCERALKLCKFSPPN